MLALQNQETTGYVEFYSNKGLRKIDSKRVYKSLNRNLTKSLPLPVVLYNREDKKAKYLDFKEYYDIEKKRCSNNI